MVQAVEKFTTFRSTTIEETKPLSRTKLPTIIICKQYNNSKLAANIGKQGYYDLDSFLIGVNFDYSVISWEGIENRSFSNITETMYDPIYSLENMKIKRHLDDFKEEQQHMTEHFDPYLGFCGKLDLTNLNTTHSLYF